MEDKDRAEGRPRLGTSETGAIVRSWLAASGLTANAAARRAGLAGSTLHRVVNDQVDPSVGTLEEIATACGLALELAVRPISDPVAAAAARCLLEEGYGTEFDVSRWTSRLERLAGADPIEILEVAGPASAPLLRPDTWLLEGDASIGHLASAGDSSGQPWALSGRAGLQLPGLRDPVPGPTMLWCHEVRTVSQLLADAPLVKVSQPSRATVAVVQADASLFFGSFIHNYLRYAAPIQILLDCLSLGGSTAEEARREAMSW